MVERDHRKLSIRRQCQLLGFSRSGFYHSSDAQPSAENANMMNEIDRIYTDCPFYGSRRITEALNRIRIKVNRKRIQRLMRIMGIAGVSPEKKTTRPHPDHTVYPYLLRNLKVERPNQVWCADITYVPMKNGYMYLVAIMDWYSRFVLSWELSNSLDSLFCVEALKRALANYGTPEIFNTDQGCQFTSEQFVQVLKDADIRISMDGRGRSLDNVFVERLWRSVKYEHIYLREYSFPLELYHGLSRYFRFYNEERPHQGLKNYTPNEVHYGLEIFGPLGGRPSRAEGEQQQSQEEYTLAPQVTGP